MIVPEIVGKKRTRLVVGVNCRKQPEFVGKKNSRSDDDPKNKFFKSHKKIFPVIKKKLTE